MLYYKVIKDNIFIGISTALDLCKYKLRDGLPPLMLTCNLDEAQYIVCANNYYHDSWLRPETVKGLYPSASIIEIDKEEFMALNKSIESGEQIEVPKTPEIPDIDNTPSDPNQEITVEYVKNTKIAEMNMMCTNLIQKGFDTKLSDGSSYHFSLTEQDQLNLITLSTMVASGETEIPYHADGEPCKFYTVNDINAILTAATAWKTYQVTYNNSLKTYINSLEKITDISAITYGIEIPVDYQSDVLKALLMQQQ